MICSIHLHPFSFLTKFLHFCAFKTAVPEHGALLSQCSFPTANAMKSTMYSISPASSEEDQKFYVCTVKDEVNLDTVLLPPLLKGMFLQELK